jgi:hypothetical protein
MPASTLVPRLVPRRTVPLAVVAAATAGLLAGCASAPAPPVSATASGHQSQHATAGSSSAPATVPGLNGLAVCQPADLEVAVDTSQAGAAAGSTEYPVNFTNISSAPCGLYGYPGMSFVTAAGGSGTQIGAAAQRDPAFPDLAVRLPAGGTAHSWLQVAQAGSYPASACQPTTAHWLRVFPPGDTAASYVKVSFDACASASTPLLTVMPIRSGRGVRGVTP